MSLSTAVGMVKVKVEPCPSVLVAHILPLWSSIIDLVIYNPNPVPLDPCSSDPETRKNLVNNLGNASFGIPSPVSWPGIY